MKTLNEQIEKVRELIRKCYGVVASKNGTVPEVGERTMANLPNAIASTHDTLEELTITENGTYTPQEGVDGFSKVTANVVPTKRVVLPDTNLRVNNNVIIDGYWAGELVDTSKMTRMAAMFQSCSHLQELDVSDWDVSGVTTMATLFTFCYRLLYLDVSNWDTRNVTNMQSLFHDCISLSFLDVSKWDVSKVTRMDAMFRSLQSLGSLDLTKWDVSKVTNVDYMFYDQNSKGTLRSIIGGRTIEDVISNDISCLNGLRVAQSNMFGNVKNLDRASLRALINGLADLTGQTAQTLTLGSTLMAKLTEEDIAIAVNKNWTIS